jgi:hypothetical protein
MKDKLIPSREVALHILLLPIEWNWSSSIGARQNLVLSRRRDVAVSYPFMNDEEKAKADKWFKEEEHGGLWD